MPTRRLLILSILMIFTTHSARAALDFYSATVPVESQSAAARNQAVALGLQQVLVKVSGRSDSLAHPVIRDALPRAAGLLLAYSYETVQVPGPDESDLDGELIPEEQQQLTMRFEPVGVRDLLRNAGQPILSASRPTVIAWLAIDDDELRILTEQQQDEELVARIRAAAERRGVRLILPVGDLEDGLFVDAAAVWRYREDQVLEASNRYHADTMLIGRLVKTSTGRWLGDWRYLIENSAVSANTDQQEPDALFDRLMAAIAEEQSQRYAVLARPGEFQQLLVSVSGIWNFPDYARLAEYLQRLNSVRQASVRQVDGENLEFDVLTDSSSDALRREIALGDLLLVNDSGAGDVLHYVLNDGSR